MLMGHWVQLSPAGLHSGSKLVNANLVQTWMTGLALFVPDMQGNAAGPAQGEWLDGMIWVAAQKPWASLARILMYRCFKSTAEL